MGKVLCFGEILMRMSPDTESKWLQQNALPVFLGGAELNVATALASWKIPVAYSTAMPSNYLSRQLLQYVSEKNIDISTVYNFTGGTRDVIGLNYHPTLTSLTTTTHYATKWTSGVHLFGNHATTVPTVPTDSFLMYGNDVVAGNSAPHFKTETGDIIKLYKYVNAAFGNTINTGDANTDAAISALISALTAHGLISTS